MIRIIESRRAQEIKQIMRDMQVDAYGIKIMLPKALSCLVKIAALSNISANILKQEMLSLGGDVALSRGALTGKVKKTSCLMMGSFSQFSRLEEKLKKQPFGLHRLAIDLASSLHNYQREKFSLELGRFKLYLGSSTRVMGIVNLTPDSFSGDGLYQGAGFRVQGPGHILDYCQKIVDDGADIIDLGGQSSRPGSRAVSLKVELARTIPVIKQLAKKIKVPISIDTDKPEVAAQALDNGAVLINDITGLRNPKMLKIAAQYRAAVVLMHMQGSPRNMQKNPHYLSLLDEIMEFFNKGIEKAGLAGIGKEKIIIDPGIGFGKTVEHNLSILKELKSFRVLGRPILVGPSRKSFIGKILKLPPQESLCGTIASCVLAAQNGVSIVRAHDVRQVKEALKIQQAVNK